MDGDLNEQELCDLDKLFRTVASIFRKFFRGQDVEAVARPPGWSIGLEACPRSPDWT